MAAKAHIDSISIGPIDINKHVVYYLNELNNSIIIDCAFIMQNTMRLQCSFGGHFENRCQDSHRQYFDWSHSYKFA